MTISATSSAAIHFDTAATGRRHPVIASVLAASLIISLVVPPAVAQPHGSRYARDDDGARGDGKEMRKGSRKDARKVTRTDVPREVPLRASFVRPEPVRGDLIRVDSRGDYRDRGGKWGSRTYRRPIVTGTVIHVAPNRIRHYRNVVVVRPYGRWYGGYGRYHRDADAWRFLAFTAITLAILNNLNERQQRSYEQAQVTAATAPIGQTITWNDNGAAGTVTPLRDGTSNTGAYCREFQQTVTIAGRTEDAYGTACRKPDGAWEVVSSGQ